MYFVGSDQPRTRSFHWAKKQQNPKQKTINKHCPSDSRLFGGLRSESPALCFTTSTRSHPPPGSVWRRPVQQPELLVGRCLHRYSINFLQCRRIPITLLIIWKTLKPCHVCLVWSNLSVKGRDIAKVLKLFCPRGGAHILSRSFWSRNHVLQERMFPLRHSKEMHLHKSVPLYLLCLGML